MWQKNRSSGKIIANLITSAVLIGLAITTFFYRQAVVDYITVLSFKPGDGVVALVDRAGMNNYGRFLYLASQPELQDADSFNSSCDRIEDTTSILGCFSDNKIYVYNVTDTTLDGIKESTATHETLHAAYERLSSSEKTRINALLEAEYVKLEGNADFTELMNFYDRAEPGQRDNELHSIIGTEVADISPELETYYSRYFSNRQSVVALNAKYQSVFKELSNQANQLSTEINNLVATINGNTNEYNSSAATLNSDILDFNKRAASDDFSSVYAFNIERAELVDRVNTLSALRNTISSDRDKYESLLEQYNSISAQTKKLYDSIDSTLVSAPSV